MSLTGQGGGEGVVSKGCSDIGEQRGGCMGMVRQKGLRHGLEGQHPLLRTGLCLNARVSIICFQVGIWFGLRWFFFWTFLKAKYHRPKGNTASGIHSLKDRKCIEPHF